MYRLLVRRTPCDRWSFWTETKSILVIVDNITIIESYGWQWKVKEVKECCTVN